jgi:hypothetical protein
MHKQTGRTEEQADKNSLHWLRILIVVQDKKFDQYTANQKIITT